MDDYTLLNGVTLAYIGDAYYELMIRQHILQKKYTKVHDLHRLAVRYVSAEAQALIIHHLTENHFLTEEEHKIVKRGRNSKVNVKRPHLDRMTYKHSTSFEALIGYLYLTQEIERLDKIIKQAIQIIENGDA